MYALIKVWPSQGAAQCHKKGCCVKEMLMTPGLVRDCGRLLPGRRQRAWPLDTGIAMVPACTRQPSTALPALLLG
jgi:hypothetical protein